MRAIGLCRTSVSAGEMCMTGARASGLQLFYQSPYCLQDMFIRLS